MPAFKVGDKVIINAFRREKTCNHLINGHTCRIKSIDEIQDYYPPYCLGQSCCYSLIWLQEDNPGRKCEITTSLYIWLESDLSQLPLFLHTLADSSGLPDA